MKKRIITALVAIAVILVPCFAFLHTVVLPVILSLFSAIAVYELIRTSGSKNVFLISFSCITAAAIPFLFHFRIDVPVAPLATAYFIVYLIMLLFKFSQTTFNQILMAMFATASVPCALSVFIVLRDCYIDSPDIFTKENGIFFILTAMLSAWGTDTFALFSGKLFGKHKLCPRISPNKTVEGAIGGVICAVSLNTASFFIFDRFFFTLHNIAWWQIIIMSTVLSVISIFGDLSASIIKRNNNIKDFGNLFPGHGGVMDRIDSCVFVLAALYLTYNFI